MTFSTSSTAGSAGGFLGRRPSHPARADLFHSPLTAAWAIMGSRPTVVRQNGRTSIWVFAAVEPATGWSLAMPFRDVNTETMQAFLDAAASKLHCHEHAVMILDGAGWHCAHRLRWPRRITPPFLPPYSPGLNPVERLWHWLREHHGSNRTYAYEQALVEESIRSHKTLRRKDIRSICRIRWITPEDYV